MDIDLSKDNNIKVLRGKYKGRKGYINTEAPKHHLSNEKRYSLRIQTGIGWKTLLMHRSGFQLIE